MELTEILARVDHTLLKQTATFSDIQQVCDDGIRFHCASVCIPPCYIKQAADYVHGKIPLCTVIGFPNGYTTSASKCFEAREAIVNGASEIDMVIDIGALCAGADAFVLEQIRAVKQVSTKVILKVIVETCLLTQEEKIRACRIVSDSGADYIKTSTGFAGGGATAADISLFAEHVAPHVKIKAAGGIATIQDAQLFLKLGAERLGTSRLVAIAKENL